MKKTTKRNIILSTGVLGCAAMLFAASVGHVSAARAEEFAGHYVPDFSNYAAAKAYSAELNVDIMRESVVLLKNNGALPLAKGDSVSLFGARAYEPIVGGTGSGGSASAYYSLPLSLEKAGFKVNAALEPYYASHREAYLISSGMGASPSPIDHDIDQLAADLGGSFDLFNDAAIITFGRVGGESGDLFVRNLPSAVAADKTQHVLQLFDGEKELLKLAKERFEKVVVLLNTANVMECAELEDDPGIDAVLWIGEGGTSGLKAIGEVLNGTVNPSGRTADIWPANFRKDPVWQNFGDNSQHFTLNEDGSFNTLGTPNASTKAEGLSGTRPSLEEEESIYVGYKYYETAAADGVLDKVPGYEEEKALIPAEKDGDKYYNRSTGVVYPFGYGLSYSKFSQTFVSEASEIAAAINAAGHLDDMIKVKVKVTNNGSVAGKEVVQLYNHAPYVNGGIEKAEVSLVGFEKTKKLQPGESQTVAVNVRIGDFFSFDYDDKNANEFAGWELEAGEYALRLQSNSHEKIAELPLTLNAKQIKEDGKVATAALGAADSYNRFSKGDDYDSLLNMKDEGSVATMKLLSRADFVGTFPTYPTTNDTVYTGRVFALLQNNTSRSGTSKNEGNTYGAYYRYTSYYNSTDDRETDPWYKTVEQIPESWTQAVDASGRTRENGWTDVILSEMAGLNYWDNESIVPEGHPYEGKTHAEAWDLFMNQLTLEEMATCLTNGGYRTPALGVVGKKQSGDQDGPARIGATSGWTTNGSNVSDFYEDGGDAAEGRSNNTLEARGTSWACEVNVASTFNKELAHKQGLMVGNEALFNGSAGWYGPAMNLHRSPFSGRNFEYYSQDGVHGGYIAAAVVSGAQSKGLVVWAKHFAMNDQETNRTGGGTFVSEQAMRENALKDFEFAIKFGHATALMTAFNRVGAINAYANWQLNIGLARNEWGFKGMAVTDYYSNSLAKANYLQRGGCELPLNGGNNYNAGQTGQSTNQNVITGVWDPELRGGKGDVRDGITITTGEGENAVSFIPESPTQYYTIRNGALHVLWNGANSANNQNGIPTVGAGNNATSVTNLNLFGGEYEGTGNNKTLTIKTGTVSVDVGIKAEYLAGQAASYETTGLPEGLSINAQGKLVGTASEAGTFSVTVRAVIDNYILRTNSFRLVVEPNATVEKGAPISFPVAGPAVGDPFNYNGTNYAITSVNAPQLRNAPAGLQIVQVTEEQATEEKPAGYYVEGTIDEAGSFAISVRFTVHYTRSNRDRTGNIDSTFYVLVNGEVGPQPVVHGGIVSSVINEEGDLVITYEDGAVVNVGHVVGADGAQGAQGPAGEAGAQGPQGEKGETGAQGPQGEKGETGAQGPKGDKGDTGAQGPQGEKGEKGDKGDQGEQGPQGEKGDIGEAAKGCSSQIGSVSAVALLSVLAISFAGVVVLRRHYKKEN